MNISPQEYPLSPRSSRKGLVLVYTGNGKGKTTSALGLAFRALGWNWSVFMVQFLKGKWNTGERILATHFPFPFEIHSFGEGFTWETRDFERERAGVLEAWTLAEQVIRNGVHDLVILDEINYVLSRNYLEWNTVGNVLQNRPTWMHVVLTGQDAPKAAVEYADLVTEMRSVKHPFDTGIKGQQGIEF
ncbi:MAG TPA: cob(I)yrinic acid a,c-diamide adenosyltransferase [bacterium]|nr:cob(I)yrinic acid a,c-diamide adenosyltransferase [bacterium]HQL60741.1 cob(I)yrinic acid a,c-diamide adenosyltransferase [bacterium]